MGIDGLLSLLRPVTQKEHISKFKGKRVAVDGLPWLYKGCYGYTYQLNQQVPSNQFMYYILQMLELLHFYNIKPVLVFDGRSLAKKSATLEKRAKLKMENKQKAMESLAKDELGEARKFFSRCIIIDERIISTTFDCLRAKGVEFIVAPYEADSQIGKLVDVGYVDAAISEDSDLLLYGINLILKLNVNGECDYIDLQAAEPEAYKETPSLYKWLRFDRYDRIRACVMAGCDYLDNIRGVGLKTAISLIDELKDQAKIIEKLRSSKATKDRVPEDYLRSVQKTMVIFLCAKVYNPNSKRLEAFSDPKQHHERVKYDELELEELIGSSYDYTDEVRTGLVNVNSLEKRQCKPVNFKTFFCLPLNRNNLLVQEARYRIKRHEEAAVLESVFSKDQLDEAIREEKEEQARLEIQRKRLEEEKKQQNLKVDNFLNRMMDGVLDQPSSEEQDDKTQPLLTQEAQHSEDEGQSESIDYSKLNPFFKRPE